MKTFISLLTLLFLVTNSFAQRTSEVNENSGKEITFQLSDASTPKDEFRMHMNEFKNIQTNQISLSRTTRNPLRYKQRKILRSIFKKRIQKRYA